MRKQKPTSEPVKPELRGTSGPWAGRTYPLGACTSVGRTPPCDIVLDDDSVSRKHGEIVKRGDSFFLRDLGSANGCFRNGVKKTEARLRPGDRIRFGEVEFAFTGPVSRKRQIVAIAAGLVLLVVALAVASHSPENLRFEAGPRFKVGPAPPPVAAEPEGREDTLSRHAVRMKGYLEQSAWDKALSEAESLLAIDPISNEARQVQRTARREQDFQRLFEEGKSKQALSQDTVAIDLLMKIAPDSTYYRRARMEVQKLAAALIPRYRDECRDFSRLRKLDSAREACSRYLGLTCHERVDADAERWLRQAEAKSAQESWRCPSKLAHWFREVEPQGDLLRGSLEQRYPEPEIGSAMALFALEGKTKQAIEKLKKLRADRRMEKHHALVDTLLAQLLLIDGKYSDGQSLYMQDRIKEADQEWQIAMDADARVMPPGMHSSVVREIRRSLGQGHARQGKVHSERRQWKLAFEAFKRGLDADPSHLEIRQGLFVLESEANKILDGDPSCPDLTEVLAMTLETSAAHQAAKKALERCE